MLEQTQSLRCQELIDPGWLDPDMFATSAVRVACIAGLKSIYIVGQGVSSTKGPVKFEDNVEVVSFARDWDIDPSEWTAVRSTSNDKLRRTFSPRIYADKVPVANLTPKVTAKSRRTAIAKALALTMLLGLPACTYASNRRGRLIVDTGCGKDMVSESTVTEEIVSEHSVRRKHPIRMQTANGVVGLTNGITFDIQKLKQSITVVVGKDKPDFLSVGYRCQDLGYAIGHVIIFRILYCPMAKRKFTWRSISLFHTCQIQAILPYTKPLHRQGIFL